MNTDEIMQIALTMSGLEEIPDDTAIHVSGTDIKKVLIGVDIGTAELLLAKQLGFDLVIGHHPPGGTTRSNFPNVVIRQIQQMVEAGIPSHIAEKALQPRLQAVKMTAHVSNYDRVPSAARLLDIPFMNIHLPLDIVCRRRFIEAIEAGTSKVENAKVIDAIHAMNELPEMKLGLTEPVVYLGSKENLLGKWTVAMAGGTNGGAGVAKAYFGAGYSTVIYMHLGPSDLKELKKAEISGNLIATGHISSDSVGISPFVQELRKKGLEVTTMSGVFVPE